MAPVSGTFHTTWAGVERDISLHLGDRVRGVDMFADEVIQGTVLSFVSGHSAVNREVIIRTDDGGEAFVDPARFVRLATAKEVRDAAKADEVEATEGRV